ncbi:MAG: B12-binding domain-containing radical SAM protein [Alphaproteobacteria bacterium]
MKIGFLYPSWTKSYGLFGYFARSNSSWPPMNLALLATIARDAGHEAFIIDGAIEQMEVDELVDAVLAAKPDIIGLTTYTPFFHVQVELAKAIKEKAPDIPIIIGGSHATIVGAKALLPCFDYVYAGEAEQHLATFLDTLESGGDLSVVDGLVWRDGDEVRANEKGRFEGDFDAMPIPDRSFLQHEKYFLGTLQGKQHFSLVQTTRGCPWECIFCASKELNTTRILRRSPESVIEELKIAVNDYGIEHIFFVDDVLTFKKDHILKVCDLIEEAGLKFTWESSTRANLVDDATMKRMAECGLIRLSLGLESVDPSIRDTMNKKVPLKYYTEANQIMNKHGVEVLNSVMIGLPGESTKTVRSLLKFLRDSKEIKQANLAVAVPYPGTEFHRMAKAGENGLKLHTDDFSEYRRYGSAVTTVGDLTPEDLVELQNEGFVSIYSAPWRWRPMYGKHGVIGFLLLGVRVWQLMKWKTKKAFRFIFNTTLEPVLVAQGHQGDPKNPNG